MGLTQGIEVSLPHLLAGEDGLAVERVAGCGHSGANEAGWAVANGADDLTAGIGRLHHARQLLAEGAVPCNSMATCAHVQAHATL
jgi:hypothetical protein